MVDSIHPNPVALSRGARALHARNMYQILGRDLETAVDFVICWTPNSAPVGGTRTAIVLAHQHNIPVFNLGNRGNRMFMEAIVKDQQWVDESW